MKDKLLLKISSDLKLNRYKDESECEFHQRIIYSAGAAWVKSLVYVIPTRI